MEPAIENEDRIPHKRVWSVKDTERTLMLDVYHKQLDPKRSESP